jgi:hypothetical protein
MKQILNNIIPSVIRISNGDYLSDKFDFLPSGIIDKTYTGIGGTSLELDCERNSIVVVPYNNIANSKESKKSVTKGYSVHKYKRDKQDLLKSSLSKYIEEVKSNGQPIKLVCVNDQLLYLKQELSDLEFDFKSFFLLFDEIDSMQEQSAFRSVMDKCMDVYIEHPKEKRAMITATLRKFTHPDLKNEPEHKVICTDRPKQDLEVVISDRALDDIYTQIKNKVEVDDSKIVVACNHIKTAIVLCSNFKKEFPKVSLGILCSPGSKKAVGCLYKTLEAPGNLPCQVNVITAAYFNGCDIIDKYHSIIFSSIRIASLQLSPSTIIQIVGRGRCGLLSSQLIIQKDKRKDSYKRFTEQELVAFGRQSAKIREGLKTMTDDLGEIGMDLMQVVHGILVSGFKDFPAVCRKVDQLDKWEISYFKIDQRLIEQETSLLLENLDDYIEVLENSFCVVLKESLGAEDVLVKDGIDLPNLLAEILNDLNIYLDSCFYITTKDDLLKFKSQYNAFNLQELEISIKILSLGIERKWELKVLQEQINISFREKRIKASLKLLYSRLLWCSMQGDNKLSRFVQKVIKFNIHYTVKEFGEKEKVLSRLIQTDKTLAPVKYNDLRMLLAETPSLFRKVILNFEEAKPTLVGKSTRVIIPLSFSSHEFPFS